MHQLLFCPSSPACHPVVAPQQTESQLLLHLSHRTFVPGLFPSSLGFESGWLVLSQSSELMLSDNRVAPACSSESTQMPPLELASWQLSPSLPSPSLLELVLMMVHSHSSQLDCPQNLDGWASVPYPTGMCLCPSSS